MITSKERAFLRGKANTLTANYQIGKGGITDSVCTSISEALEANELIKIKVAAATNSNIVQCIGRIFVLYRPAREKEKRRFLV